MPRHKMSQTDLEFIPCQAEGMKIFALYHLEPQELSKFASHAKLSMKTNFKHPRFNHLDMHRLIIRHKYRTTY